MCAGLIWFRIGASGGPYEHGEEPVGSEKPREFLE
jgi:hypothetical protein